MKTYIALLRGINVSGQKKILMKDLSSIFESLGFMNVKTYIQSGNVLFQDKSKNVKELIALEPVSKLPIKKVKSNDRACEIKRCKIIFRF
ncbi:DUF1697 domain-containing protein, partial [Leptospira kirschneri]|uniref:DUF1697 domain-containing protein n=1 Tax=Leptospira kirschneri TaxID=29507 RepID=UPI0002BD40C6